MDALEGFPISLMLALSSNAWHRTSVLDVACKIEYVI